MNNDPSRFRQASRNTPDEINYRLKMDRYIQESSGSFYEKFENFPKYVSRQILARYLAFYEIFKEALDVHGDIIECGVNDGASLMYFSQLSSILEPVNFQRKIVGFDTFSGFASIHDMDKSDISPSTEMKKGGFSSESYDDLEQGISLYDENRFINNIKKVQLVKGNACTTIPEYLKKNPHVVVSVLHLDFDLYAPTKVALEHFSSRIPKGGIIIFDELNNQTWPGESIAVMESLGIHNLRLKRFPFEPHVCYAVCE